MFGGGVAETHQEPQIAHTGDSPEATRLPCLVGCDCRLGCRGW